MHLALLGDSTLDNAPYTNGGPAVVDHFSSRLTGDDRATLLAVDGAISERGPAQVEQRPCSPISCDERRMNALAEGNHYPCIAISYIDDKRN